MKKFLLFLILFLFAVATGNSQTATSVADGNWYMPTTWDCMCIPTTSYTVNINHNVVLDNDFALSGGAINIGTNGTLRENNPGRYLVMYTGSIVNNGKMKLSNLAFYGGTFTNNDSCLVYSKFYSGAEAQNNGIIKEVDSLFIQSVFHNNNNGTLEAFRVTLNDSLMNFGQMTVSDLMNLSWFDNEGTADFINFYSTNFTMNSNQMDFTDLTNDGRFENYGFMYGNANFSNIGFFYNDYNAFFSIDNDFSNVDSTNHLAYFYNNGRVFIGGHFYNRDTINGNVGGFFCIGQESTNDGVMLGSFNFYDQTNGGPPSANNGSISDSITYLVYPCTPGFEAIDKPLPVLIVYPNPVTKNLYFEFAGVPTKTTITITDLLGNIIFLQSADGDNKIVFDRGETPAGVYVYRVVTGTDIFTGKIILQ